MNKDTIYRQAAIDDLNLADDRGQIYSILDVIKVIKALPSTQPEDYANGFADGYKQGQKDAQPERKMGEWVWSDEDASWKCGSCDCVFEEIDWKPEYNYCPNCGADMRGDNHEDD